MLWPTSKLHTQHFWPHVCCAKLLPEMDFLCICTDLLNTYLLLNNRICINITTIGYNNILLSIVKLTFQYSCSYVFKFSNICVIYITLLLHNLSWGLQRWTIMFALKFARSGRWTELYISKDYLSFFVCRRLIILYLF